MAMLFCYPDSIREDMPMETMRLGRTNLVISRSGFGALPIQRVNPADAGILLRKAFAGGITFFDTARGYTDSEEKIGLALAEVRADLVIATKTHARDRQTFFQHLETSLRLMKTDWIDVYQLHNPAQLPDPADPDGVYAAMLEARQKGMIRFIGLTSHRLGLALEAAASRLYDTIQFPLSSLSSQADLQLIEACRAADAGFIAMKALSGGLITNIAANFAFLRQFDNLVPIWGIQRQTELEEFLALEERPPVLDAATLAELDLERAALSGSFCRGCGYCLPCSADIPISMAARINLLIARSAFGRFL